MATDGQSYAIIDTSTLINFLRVNRVDLLAAHPVYTFVITNHVKLEVTDHFPVQLSALRTAIDSCILVEIEVNSIDELQTFAQLASTKRFGDGECAAIAAALHRKSTLVIDDKRATKEAERLDATLNIVATAGIMLELIKAGLLEVAEADQIKEAWQLEHKFRMPFLSFADLI